jgi:RNA polymerase sigma-70 factor, ECF subfamily
VNNDKITIEQFKTGDLAAFELVFKEYHRPLVNYATTIVKDADESEDIVQQVFITVWNKRSTIDIHTSIRSFLYKAVYNACLNKIKQQAVRKNYAKEIQLNHGNVSTDAGIQQKELQQKIDEAIEELPEQCGRIFKMSRFDNLKYQEIADTMTLSVKTVENQMGKALKLMREKLKEYLPYIVLFIIKRYSE